MHAWRIFLIIASVVLLAGCGSIARGVTEAVLESGGEEEDLRMCEVRGPTFDGVAPLLAEQEGAGGVGAAERPVLKILMVHGIGAHTPGYSGPLADELARELGLVVTAPRPRRLEIAHELFPDAELGELNVSRYVNEAGDREMLFYELTWSPISAPSKEAIAFDSSAQYADRRATFNNLAKGFANDKLTDPLVYTGYKGEQILVAAGQSICWMLTREWSTLPEGAPGMCDIEPEALPLIERDGHAIITHSLGSRITIDALQRALNLPEFREERYAGFLRTTREKDMPVFMLANQLPLIEVGQAPQQVTNAIPAYCTPEGAHFGERFFDELEIIAFSDPNDLLSYPIPPSFVDDYMDSRLCPAVTNVTLNVANVRSVFGLGELADPGTAHVGYAEDERVVAMIAHGAGHAGAAPIVRERCEFWRTDRSLQ